MVAIDRLREIPARRLAAPLATLIILGVGGSAVAWLDVDWQAVASLGYGGVFLACFASALTIVVPAPGIVAVFLAGRALDPVLVGLSAGIGSAIGESSGYILGRSGRAALGNGSADSPLAARIEGLVRRYGVPTILVLAIVPNPFFDMAGIAAGATRMSPAAFFAATAIGKFVRMTAVALAGQYALTWILP
jgi:membrane protein YqaA with SNARE-associated domain